MVRLVLAGSDVEDLRRAESLLLAKGVPVAGVCERESQVLDILRHNPVPGLATVIIAQQGGSLQRDDSIDALRLLEKVARQAHVAVISNTEEDFKKLVEAGALDILQSPISEQADRLHFLAAKWQHTLQPSAHTDFSADCGDSVQQSFSMSLAHIPPMDDSFEELLGPGSATSCGTALDWEESDELAQSILPGLFGDGAHLSTSPFDMIEFGAPTAVAHGQPKHVANSGSSESSFVHVPSCSRQTSLTTCLSGKRKSEDFGELSRGTSCDTSRPSDLMDDARCKKHKVEWTPELHHIFTSVVESVGVDRAVPSQILSGMGAAGRDLTRQNIASHLQKYRNRNRINSVFGVSAPTPMRASSAPLGTLNQAMPGASLLSHSSCQLPALLPGTPCWAVGMPQSAPVPVSWSAWPAGPPPLPQALPPLAPTQPSLALLASLQQAMREPMGKLPLGLRLDTNAVQSSWKAVAGSQQLQHT